MSQVQRALTFVSATTVTATEEATNHPATNVALFSKWRRTARSTTTTDGWTVTFDFGATTSLPGVFVNNANFSNALIASSPNGSTWTELTGLGTPMTRDARVDRRKVWIPLTFNARYMRIRCFTLDGGETFFELGAVAFPSPVTNMTRNWGPPRWTPREPVTSLAYPGGGGEDNTEGPTLMSYELDFGPNSNIAMSDLLTMRKQGRLPFFMFENRGDTSAAYVLRRTAEVPFSEGFNIMSAGPWSFEETM